MGDEADDILTSFKLSTLQLKQYHTVKTKFDEHFVVRQNVIFQRAKFNRRCQEDGKTVDTFITALHTLAEHCDYGTLKDEMIRDRIVVGLQDSKLSEKLQLDPELSLAKAINHARQSEAVKKQQALLRNDFKDSEDAKKNVDAVKVTRKNPPKLKDENGPKPKKTPLKKPPSQPSSTRCERCGHLPPHKRANCPAKDATCFNCSKRGHWGTVCKSPKTVGKVEEDKNLFLGEIGTETNNTFWSVDLMLNNAQVRFKIDTGADVTVIPDKIYSNPRKIKQDIIWSSSYFTPRAWMFCGKNPERRQNNGAGDIRSERCPQRPAWSSSYRNSCHSTKG